MRPKLDKFSENISDSCANYSAVTVEDAALAEAASPCGERSNVAHRARVRGALIQVEEALRATQEKIARYVEREGDKEASVNRIETLQVEEWSTS